MRIVRPTLALAAALLATGCGFKVAPAPQPTLRSTAQEVFWQRLTHLCGRAFAGRMVEVAAKEQRTSPMSRFMSSSFASVHAVDEPGERSVTRVLVGLVAAVVAARLLGAAVEPFVELAVAAA